MEKPFHWHGFRDGMFPLSAEVLLQVEIMLSGPSVVEEGYVTKVLHDSGYMDPRPVYGTKVWRLAAQRGLEYAVDQVSGSYRIVLRQIRGTILDTTPTAVAYTAILAFYQKVGHELSVEESTQLESLVWRSRVNCSIELIPDFKEHKLYVYNLPE